MGKENFRVEIRAESDASEAPYELADELFSFLQEKLELLLPSDDELDCLEGLDDAYASGATDVGPRELSYWFQDSLEFTVAAVPHWYEGALALFSAEACALAGTYGYEIVSPRETPAEWLKRVPGYLIFIYDDVLYAVSSSQEPVVITPDGFEDLETLDDKLQERIRQVLEDGICFCGLCRHVRDG